MDDYNRVNQLLKDVCDAKDKAIQNKTIESNGLSMRKLSEVLVLLGKVHREDLVNNTYVAEIPGGIANKNHAVVALELSENALKIAAYAEEGLINQHTSEGVIKEIERRISE